MDQERTLVVGGDFQVAGFQDPIVNQLAASQGDDSIGLVGQFEIVGGDDEGGAGLTVEIEEEVGNGMAGFFVEIACGLVCEENARLIDESTSDRDALLFTAR